MTDLRERVPAHALMEKVVRLRGTPDLVDLPFGIIKPSKDGMGWLRGVNGELLMASRLHSLGPDWTVLHSVPVGDRGSDIDHIAVGPAGVFAINSKRLIDRRVWVAGGRFLVDGQKREYIRNSAYEAARVEKVLRNAGIVVPIVPVIAISGCKRLTIKRQAEWDGRPVGVALMNDVVRRIRKRAAVVAPRDVARIAELFSEPAAWSRRSVEMSDASEIRTTFAIIDRGVSRYRAVLIACLGLIVAAASLLTFVLSDALVRAL